MEHTHMCTHLHVFTLYMYNALPIPPPFPSIPLPLLFPLHLQGVTGDPPHYTGKSPTTWDVRVFVQALQSLLPNLNWREVILYLDYPESISLPRRTKLNR